MRKTIAELIKDKDF